MNYIELINNVWALREQGVISVYDADLYLYLVHRSNKLGWKNPFNQSTEIICAVLGINRNALASRRNRLRQLGLIKFKEGITKQKPAAYELCSLNDTLLATRLDTLDGLQDNVLSDMHTSDEAGRDQTVGGRRADYQLVISAFNETCKSLPKVKRLTHQRKQKLDMVAQHIGIGKLLECFRLVESSRFLSKREGKWRATFDWILEPDNMVKILEGSYNDESRYSTQGISEHCGRHEAERYGADSWAAAAQAV